VVVGQDAADAAKQFNDDITRLKAVCQGWFIQISQSLLPLLDEWSGDAVELGKDHEDLGNKTQVLIKTLYALLAVGDALAGGFRVIGATVSTVVIAIGNAARNASALYDAFSKQDFSLNPVKNFQSSLSAWKQFYQTFNSNNQAARDTVSDLWSSASDGMQKDYEALKSNVAKIAGDIPKVFPKVAASKAAGDIISNIYGDPDKNAKDAGKIRDAINGILADPTGANAKQQAAQAQALANAYAALQKKIEDLNGAANPDQKAYSDLVSDLISISQAGAAIIKNGGDVAQTQKMVAEAIDAAQQKYAKALAAPMNAANAYNKALQDQLTAQKNLLDVNVKTMTMGDQEAANYKQLAQDAADAAKAVTDFENAHQQHPNSMTDEQYKTELAGLKEYLADRHQLLIDSQQQEAAVQGDFNAGLQKGMADFIEQMKDKFSQGKQFIQDFTSGFSDAFEQWASGAESAKKAFGDFIDQLFADALKFVANQAVAKFFDYLKNLNGNGTSGASSGSSGGTGFWGGLISAFGSFFGGGKAGGGPVAAGMLYRVNEQRPEMLTVGGQDFLMMGKQGGYVTPNPNPSRDPRGNTFVFNLQPTSSRQTAEQIATATSRKLRLAQARNG
jgi:lambda family phage tail tape measure protein